MSLETDVQELTQATTDLLVAVNVSKATLDGKVEDAGDFATASLNSANASAASAATATTQATAAGTARTGAETARDAAVVAQNNAVAVVTGGTATLTPSATKIPLSDAQGKIAKGWLTNTDLVEQTDIGTGPNEIPLNQFLGELAYLDTQNIPTLGINVANASTANVTNLMQVTEISNAVPSLNLDFAKVKQLDPRITFTRASTGTYYDGKTVAKAEENLFRQSQDFAGSTWVTSNITLGSGVPAPDGTLTAYAITTNNSTNAFQNSTTPPTVSASTTYTISIWMRAITGTVTVPLLFVPIPSYASTTNSVTLTTTWQQFSVTATTPAGTTQLFLALNNIANGTTFYAWGAQLEQRAQATAYTPTTTQPVTNYIPVMLTAASGVPRFEHNPVTGESLGLEIEEQRTNLVLRSEEFDNAAWAKTSVTVTANTIVSPDGTLNGDLAAGTVSVTSYIESAAITVSASTTYNVSLYAKAGSSTLSRIRLYNSALGTELAGVVIAWTAGVPSTSSVSGTWVTAPTYTAVGNGWYRVSGAFSSGAFTGIKALIYPDQSAGGANMFLWGAQLEAGAFPTSYIPTVASQVTRAADSAVMTGANFSSWYRQGQGTVFTEFTPAATTGGDGMSVISIAAALANGYLLYKGSFAAGLFAYADNNATTSLGNLSVGVPTKATIAYNGVSNVGAANGAAPVNIPLGTVAPPIQMFIGRSAYSTIFSGLFKKITYYPQRLSNAELVEMTA